MQSGECVWHENLKQQRNRAKGTEEGDYTEERNSRKKKRRNSEEFIGSLTVESWEVLRI